MTWRESWLARQHAVRAERMALIQTALATWVEAATGGSLAAGEARNLLDQAKIWHHPRNAHQVHRHLTEHPDAFTCPDPHCPLPFAELLRLLDKAGHGDRITLLACVGCGRTDQYLRLLSPAGRICENCRDRPPRNAVSRSHLAAVQADLVDQVQTATGGALSAEKARELLEQLPTFGHPQWALRLRVYLTEHPDAFASPDPTAPLALTDLLRLLHHDGHAVTLRACAVCGRIDRPLTTLLPAGRACNPCGVRARWRRCDRCGRDGQITAIRPDGRICARCYRTDPEAFVDCAGCGRHRFPTARRGDGSPLCQTCAPLRAPRRCTGCGQTRLIVAGREDGSLCERCYTSPARLCGICGEIRPISFRAKDGRPDTCDRCYRHLGDCVTCGRHRDGSIREGRFYCETHYPGRQDICADCGNTTRIATSNWPIGSMCATCLTRRRRNPAPCGRCGTAHILVGRDEHGTDLCGPCTGHPELDWACRRCGHPGDLYSDGYCTGCVVADRLDALFDRGDGTVSTQLQPLLIALKATKPWTALSWLRRSTAALLAELAAHPDALTHATLDALPQDYVTHATRAGSGEETARIAR